VQKRIGIVAMTPAGTIGLGGTLPWHLPADLAFFKRTTSGHPIVMGRKTYDSIGRPLPNRRNIVLTKNAAWSAPGVETIPSPDALGDLPGLDGTIYIIGGSKVYEAFLPTLDELLISHVSREYPGDTWFPEYQSQFEEADIVETHPDFTVKRWIRKS
jgi:dihydrofolate reductase